MNASENARFMTKSANYIEHEDVKKLKAKLHPTGAIILPKVGAALLTNKRRVLSSESAVDNNIMVLIPTEVDRDYLYQWSLTLDMNDYVQIGALPSINQATASAIKLLIPPLPEQKKIAEVLSSVDEAIAATKAAIDQTKQVKKGLLQTLLTKGIGHTKFKQTELGEVPESWEVRPLGDCFENLDHMRKPIKKGDRQKMKGRIPYYGASGIIDWVNEWLFDEPLLLISEDGANLLTRNLPIAFTISGKSFVNNHAHVFRETGIMLQSIAADLICEIGVDNYVTGSAQPKLNKAMVVKIPIPVPPMEEQHKIDDILSSANAEISISSRKLSLLQRLQSGLMSDLLTGRKRVEVPDA